MRKNAVLHAFAQRVRVDKRKTDSDGEKKQLTHTFTVLY